MSKLKEFQRTRIDAEKTSRQKLNDVLRGEGLNQIRLSINHLEISLEKVLELATDESIKATREHIDNIYYHIGMIKGAL